MLCYLRLFIICYLSLDALSLILKKDSGTVWSLFLLYGLLNKMKLLKTVPAALMLAGGVFAAMNATADDTVFTVMDDPSTAKNRLKVT